ncbi:hypothetical protein BB561_003062 [Smittium simulii]|uniref:Mediator of RNA polymerase II transcription subunit 17 n=1 Tax=Smittium simulii TaxID=133385 RepID=A0A2T9YN30_9FUNG|nr:hypothetical protein BB561_003062 [Smittium simulii]
MDFTASKEYSDSILNDHIEEKIARLWSEHPNFTGLQFDNSDTTNSIPLDDSVLDDATEPEVQEKHIESKSAPNSSVNPSTETPTLGIYENLQNKLWYARSEMAVALDVILLLLENSQEQKNASALKNDESTNNLPNNFLLPPEKGVLMLDKFQPSKNSDTEQILQYQLAIGGKQLQLNRAAKYLRKQNRRLKTLVLQNQSLFQGAINLREKSWVIQQHQSSLLGTQFYIPYGYTISGLRYGEQGIAKILLPEPLKESKGPFKTDKNQSGQNYSSETEKFKFQISELPETRLRCEIEGKCLFTSQKIYQKSDSLFEKMDILNCVNKNFDEFDSINQMLTKARSAIYSKSLFRTLQEEALLHSKGSISTSSKKNSDIGSTGSSVTDDQSDTTHQDILNIPLAVDGYSLLLKFSISSKTQSITNLKNDNDIVDSTNSQLVDNKMDIDLQSDSAIVDSTNLQLCGNKMDIDSKTDLSLYDNYSSNTTMVRMAPYISLIVASLFLSKRYSLYKNNNLIKSSNVKGAHEVLQPMLELLKYLFKIDKVDNLLRTYTKIWKTLTGDSGEFQSNTAEYALPKGANQKYSASILLGTQSSIFVNITDNKKISIIKAINVDIDAYSSPQFIESIYSSTAEVNEYLHSVITKLLLYKACQILNKVVLTVMEQNASGCDPKTINLPNEKRICLTAMKKLEFGHNPACIRGKVLANKVLVDIVIELGLVFNKAPQSTKNENFTNKEEWIDGENLEDFAFDPTNVVEYSIEASVNNQQLFTQNIERNEFQRNLSINKSISNSFVFEPLKQSDELAEELLKQSYDGSNNSKYFKFINPLYYNMINTICQVI